MQELLQCRGGLKWKRYLTDKKFIMSKIKIKQVRSLPLNELNDLLLSEKERLVKLKEVK